MNIWATWLADLPALGQRLLARTHRVSLPRTCAADERLSRLRQALCRQRAVQAGYAALDAEARAAIQDLRHRRWGISRADLHARYGTVRSWSQCAADPHPRSVAETLVLRGWLLPRTIGAAGTTRFYVPPEVRRWLPAALRLTVYGPAPTPAVPLAVRAARVLLHAAAVHPLPLRADGLPRRVVLVRLAPQLAPAPQAVALAVLGFVWPLLVDQGLVLVHAGRATASAAAERVLAQDSAVQQTQLQQAWVRSPRVDGWFRPLVRDRRGMDWPTFRCRLLAWAAALPANVVLDPAALYPALAAALGPLADAHTHGFRTVARVPWQPTRAQQVWDAALAHPLAWLGVVAWTADGAQVARPGLDLAAPDPPCWTAHAAGTLHVPHSSDQQGLTAVLPWVAWQASDAHGTTYRWTPQTVRQGLRQGARADRCLQALHAQLGAHPAGWAHPATGSGPMVQLQQATLLTTTPAVLDAAHRSRSVQRHGGTRWAPGLAVVPPEHVAALTRALERQGIAVVSPAPPAGPPLALDAATCATLWLACVCYRQHAPAAAAPGPSAQLEARLRAQVPAAVQRALAPLVAACTPDQPPPPQATPWEPQPGAHPPVPIQTVTSMAPPAAADPGWATMPALLPAAVCAAPPVRPPLARAAPTPPTTPVPTTPVPPLPDQCAALQQAIARRTTIQFCYTAADQPTACVRTVRPLVVEERYGTWYVRAFCTERRAERTFRVDRIGAIGDSGRGG